MKQSYKATINYRRYKGDVNPVHNSHELKLHNFIREMTVSFLGKGSLIGF